MTKGLKGILGAPKSAGSSHIFTFAVEEPEEDNEDSDYTQSEPEEDGAKKAKAKGKEKRLKRRSVEEEEEEEGKNKEKGKKKEDEEKKLKKRRILNGGQKEPSGWGERIPVEVLEQIFLRVVPRDGSFPALNRLARVCRHWRSVAQLPRLLQAANFGDFSSKLPLSTLSKLILSSGYTFTRTKVLDLTGFTLLGDDALHPYALRCPLLEEISLSGCDKVSMNGVQSLLQTCPQLRGFAISGARLLSKNATVQLVATTLKEKLEKLVINDLRVTDAAIKTVVQHCPSLRVLDFSSTSVGKLAIEELQKRCPKLVELNFATCVLECPRPRAGTESGGFPELEILSVAGATFSSGGGDVWGRLLHKSPRLRVLDIRQAVFFSRADLQALPPSPRLKVFLMGGCQGVSQENFQASLLKFGESLVHLDISWTNLGDDAMDGIAQICGEHLEKLECTGTQISEVGIKRILQACRRLSHLSLVSCRSAPRDLKKVFDAADLQALRKAMNIRM